MDTTSKKYIKSNDGTSLYYETNITDAQNPVIFFIHGVGGDLDAWQYVKDKLLPKGFSSITMDLRGHGKSGHPFSFKKYKLSNFIEDAIKIMDFEKIEKVILIGHSLGAVLATHIALARPERIEKLILISSSYSPPPYFKIPGALLLCNALALLSPPPIYPKHSIYPPEKFHKDVEIFGLIKTIIRNSLKSYLLSSKEILKTNIKSDLKNIKTPTLIISGNKDTIFPAPISENIHSQVPNSKLEIIKNANHVIVLNNINETVEHISNFLLNS